MEYGDIYTKKKERQRDGDLRAHVKMSASCVTRTLGKSIDIIQLWRNSEFLGTNERLETFLFCLFFLFPRFLFLPRVITIGPVY